jgi:hypothetical protein
MAAGALMLQPELEKDGGRRRMNPALRQHAVELFNILNEGIWKDDKLVAALLTGETDERFPVRKRRRRCCRSRKRSAGKTENVVAEVKSAAEV